MVPTRHYRSARVDVLIDGIRMEMNREKRKELCSEVQNMVAEDLRYLPLWSKDVTSVHRREMGEIALSPRADMSFWRVIRPGRLRHHPVRLRSDQQG